MAISTFEADEIVARANVNQRINQANAYFPVSVANGGTGKTSLSSGQILLGNGTSGITSTATLPVSKGGTGQTSLTSGNILLGNGTSGITSTSTLPVSKGGTGYTTETDVRTHFGVMKETTLYHNPAGTKTTITLSDTYTNYEYIRVFGKLGASGVSDVFKPSIVSTLSLSKDFVTVYLGALLGHGFNIGTLTFSDKTVTFGSTNCGQYSVQSGVESWIAATSSNTVGLSVHKIVGYKY